MFRGSLGLAPIAIRPCCKLLPGALRAFPRRTVFSAVGPEVVSGLCPGLCPRCGAVGVWG